MTTAQPLPSHSDVDALLAQIEAGKAADALPLINTLLEKRPSDALVWHLKGRAHRALGDFATAISAFNQALRFKPDFEEACLNLGQALEISKQFPLAVKAYEHWLKIVQAGKSKKPFLVSDAIANDMESWLRDGISCYERGDTEAGIEYFKKILAVNPDAPAPLLGMAVCFHYQHRFYEAEEMLMKAIRSKPNYAEALNALGSSLRFTGRFVQAVAVYRQAIAIDPSFAKVVWPNLARVYSEISDYEQSIAAYESALALQPENVEALIELVHMLALRCQWEKLEIRKQEMREAIVSGGSGEPFMVAVHTPEKHFENTVRWAKKRWPNGKSYDAAAPLPADVRGNGKLRIGYLSADFHRHATMALMAEMFEQHDRNRFEIFGYSYGVSDTGAERQRVSGAMERFYDVSRIGDQHVADLIRHDGIDILVEMKGYTHGHRLSIPALRPAPIQMHYLGYPGTIGANFIDYFITDAAASPSGAETEFTESLIRLPHSYQINDRKRPTAAGAKSRADYGLPREGFVFCDFNNPYKITQDMFAIWMRLLTAVPDSVIWLYGVPPESSAYLRQEAEKQGVDPARLVFAEAVAMAEHLQRYHHADLVLDTFPVCSHTTASDALWCGVPVVTLAATPFVSRVAASLLSAVGLPELITDSPEAYEALALSLARDKNKLAALKKHLENGRMQFPLFDCITTTRAVEAAYLHAAERHRQGKAPQHFSLTSDLKVIE